MTAARPDWLAAVRRHLAAVAVGSVAWEFAQMPLYTLWRTGTPGEIAYAALHCAAGDVLIAGASLLGALVLLGSPGWPHRRRMTVAGAAIAFGLGYTVYSEHLNLARGAWAYSEMMPTLPWLGVGLAPLAQWLLVPTLSLAWACRPPRRSGAHDRAVRPEATGPPSRGRSRGDPTHDARRSDHHSRRVIAPKGQAAAETLVVIVATTTVLRRRG